MISFETVNYPFLGLSCLKLVVDKIILKKQVTSYFLEKNITAIIKVITDVWRKGWARSRGAWALDSEIHWTTGTLLLLKPAMTNSWMRSDNIRTTTSSWATSRRRSRLTSRLHGALARTVGPTCGDILLRFRWACCICRDLIVLQDNFGTDKKVLVRLAVTLHTWSRIVMRCISSSRHLRSLLYNISINSLRP